MESKHAAAIRIKWSWVIIAVLYSLAIVAFATAPYTDHQLANFATIGLAGLATLILLVMLHRRLRHVNRLLVPGAVGFAVLLFVLLFELEGFSGDMMPQFRWRLGSDVRKPLQSTPIEMGDDGQRSPDADAFGDQDADQDPANPEETPSSRQFLGNDRNGVIAKREFEVPKGLEDCTVLWDIGVGPAWSSFSVAQGIAVTMEQRENKETLTAYRLSDGKLIWIKQHEGRHEHPLGGVGPRSTPTILGDSVYAYSATGMLWCVRLRSGEVIWSKNMLEHVGWSQVEFETHAPWGHSTSPLLVDGLCVVAHGGRPQESGESSGDGRSLIALDAATGEVRWTAGADQLSYGSPMLLELDGHKQIVSVNENTVSGHEVVSGETLWTFPWPGQTNGSANCAAAIQVGENRVLVGKGYGGGSTLIEIRREDGRDWAANEVWSSSRIMKTKFSHACVRGDVGFAVSNGALQAASLTDPGSLWLQPRRQRCGQGQVILVEDTLVVQNEEGKIVFRPGDDQ